MKQTPGKVIAQARRREKISQEDLAQQVGCTRSYLAKIETDSTRFSDKLGKAIAKALGIPQEQILPKRTPLPELANLLRDAREESGLTAAYLAASVGLSPSLICRFEDGSRIPDKETGEKLARVLDIPVELVVELCSDRAPRESKGITYYPTDQQREALEKEARSHQEIIDQLLNEYFALPDTPALRSRLFTELEEMGLTAHQTVQYTAFKQGREKSCKLVCFNNGKKRTKSMSVLSIVPTDRQGTRTMFKQLWITHIHNQQELDKFLVDLEVMLTKGENHEQH